MTAIIERHRLINIYIYIDEHKAAILGAILIELHITSHATVDI